MSIIEKRLFRVPWFSAILHSKSQGVGATKIEKDIGASTTSAAFDKWRCRSAYVDIYVETSVESCKFSKVAIGARNGPPLFQPPTAPIRRV